MCLVRRGLILPLMLGLCLICIPPYSAQVLSQEWGKSFNPYTGQWEDLNPPAPEQSKRQAENAPMKAAVAVPPRSPAPAAVAVPPEPDYTSKEAALQILQHEPDEAAQWVYEQPDCPSMHYLKSLTGKDVCANPFGDDVAVSCPAGTSLVIDHHPAGSDACRSARSF